MHITYVCQTNSLINAYIDSRVSCMVVFIYVKKIQRFILEDNSVIPLLKVLPNQST